MSLPNPCRVSAESSLGASLAELSEISDSQTSLRRNLRQDPSGGVQDGMGSGTVHSWQFLMGTHWPACQTCAQNPTGCNMKRRKCSIYRRSSVPRLRPGSLPLPMAIDSTHSLLQMPFASTGQEPSRRTQGRWRQRLDAEKHCVCHLTLS